MITPWRQRLVSKLPSSASPAHRACALAKTAPDGECVKLWFKAVGLGGVPGPSERWLVSTALIEEQTVTRRSRLQVMIASSDKCAFMRRQSVWDVFWYVGNPLPGAPRYCPPGSNQEEEL